MQTGGVTTADVLADLEARGLVHLSTDRDALARALADGPVTAYYGCDPTADSLHIGNLIGLLILRRLQDAGHRAIGLVGGATGLIGDPSERSDERNLLDDETLAANTAAIAAQIARVVDPDGTRGTLFVDNRSWTEDLTLIDFLRDVGRHVTINQMVARDSVRARLESEHGLSYTEFSYMLLQARDYLHLYREHDCALQIGGSDQWGNIVSGVDLVRRVEGRQVHALCWPLLTGADGTKLGKSTGGRVWLDPARTRPYELFQHWMRIDDDDLDRQLKWFTLLPVADIGELVRAQAADPGARVAHRRLAHEVTALVHGDDAARAAAEASTILFGADPTTATAAALEVVAREVACATIGPGADTVIGLLVATGLVASTSDARRSLTQGGIYLNGVRCADDGPVSARGLLHGRYALLRKGKRTYALGVATS